MCARTKCIANDALASQDQVKTKGSIQHLISLFVSSRKGSFTHKERSTCVKAATLDFYQIIYRVKVMRYLSCRI